MFICCITALRLCNIWACWRRLCSLSFCLYSSQRNTLHLLSVQWFAWYRHKAISCLHFEHVVFFWHDFAWETTCFICWHLGSLQFASLHWHACSRLCFNVSIFFLEDSPVSFSLSVLDVPLSKSNLSLTILWACFFLL